VVSQRPPQPPPQALSPARRVPHSPGLSLGGIQCPYRLSPFLGQHPAVKITIKHPSQINRDLGLLAQQMKKKPQKPVKTIALQMFSAFDNLIVIKCSP